MTTNQEQMVSTAAVRRALDSIIRAKMEKALLDPKVLHEVAATKSALVIEMILRQALAPLVRELDEDRAGLVAQALAAAESNSTATTTDA